jgi:hypothetical protein
MVTVEGTRLEGVILRSQLLVLLQRRHFCDQHGRPVGREYSEKQEIELEVSLAWQPAGSFVDASDVPCLHTWPRLDAQSCILAVKTVVFWWNYAVHS